MNISSIYSRILSVEYFLCLLTYILQVGVQEFPADIPSLVDKLFDRLESRYGRLFVDRALGYITAAKNGLAVAELEDILSCDDDVLDSVCNQWRGVSIENSGPEYEGTDCTGSVEDEGPHKNDITM